MVRWGGGSVFPTPTRWSLMLQPQSPPPAAVRGPPSPSLPSAPSSGNIPSLHAACPHQWRITRQRYKMRIYGSLPVHFLNDLRCILHLKVFSVLKGKIPQSKTSSSRTETGKRSLTLQVLAGWLISLGIYQDYYHRNSSYLQCLISSLPPPLILINRGNYCHLLSTYMCHLF